MSMSVSFSAKNLASSQNVSFGKTTPTQKIYDDMAEVAKIQFLINRHTRDKQEIPRDLSKRLESYTSEIAYDIYTARKEANPEHANDPGWSKTDWLDAQSLMDNVFDKVRIAVTGSLDWWGIKPEISDEARSKYAEMAKRILDHPIVAKFIQSSPYSDNKTYFIETGRSVPVQEFYSKELGLD